MKRLILSFAAIAALLSSCGPRSHAEKSQELIVNYFDSLALNVEIVSLQAVDTIYTEGTSFFIEDAHFQEIARLQKETEMIEDLLRSARGY